MECQEVQSNQAMTPKAGQIDIDFKLETMRDLDPYEPREKIDTSARKIVRQPLKKLVDENMLVQQKPQYPVMSEARRYF